MIKIPSRKQLLNARKRRMLAKIKARRLPTKCYGCASPLPPWRTPVCPCCGFRVLWTGARSPWAAKDSEELP